MDRWNRWKQINGSIAALTGSVAMTAAWYPSPVSAAELTNWQFDPATQQLQVTIPAGTTPRYFLLAQPARIVVDLPNTQVGNVAAQQSYGGAVRQIRVSQFDATSTRIVIELSPDAELAPGQVQLQQAAAAAGGTQWVLRPLLAGSPIAAQPALIAPPPAVPPVPVAPSVEPSTPLAASITPPASGGGEAIAPSPSASAPVEQSIPPAPIAPPSIASSVPPALAAPPAPGGGTAIAPSASASAPLPPLEPNAVEIPIEPLTPTQQANAALPPSFQAEATAIEPTETSIVPSESATSTVALNAPPAPSAALPPRPAEPDLPARDPILLPPAIDSPSGQVSVQVPPPTPSRSTAASPSSAAPQQQAATLTAPELPPALTPPTPANQVSVPPLSSSLSPRPAARPSRTVEFGQPPAAEAPPALSARRSSILLPAGTALSLRYPRDAAIEVESGRPRQEVLVLQSAVRNADGQVVFPAGTQVIGRFETDRGGTRFVAQAVSLEGRNLRLNAESATSERDRPISNNDLLVHSALGALALTLLGGLSGLGLIGGAAAGAATTYLSPPAPVVIQPNQVFEVRLTEDLPQ